LGPQGTLLCATHLGIDILHRCFTALKTLPDSPSDLTGVLHVSKTGCVCPTHALFSTGKSGRVVL
jgi:hypothetical protein